MFIGNFIPLFGELYTLFKVGVGGKGNQTGMR